MVGKKIIKAKTHVDYNDVSGDARVPGVDDEVRLDFIIAKGDFRPCETCEKGNKTINAFGWVRVC